MIDDLDTERENKLKSMFLDRMEIEKELFFKALNPLGLNEERLQKKIDEVLTDNFAKDFDDGAFDRFYPAHALRVARFVLFNLKTDISYRDDVIIASLIHNALEKQIYNKEQLQKKYGKWVCEAICALTQDRVAMQTLEGRESYYQQLYSMDDEVLLIKICDKFDNLFAQCIHDDEARRESYYLEVEQYLTPKMPQVAPQIFPHVAPLLKKNREIGHYLPNYT